MIKRLTAKTQELNPIQPSAGTVSKALSIKPDSEDIINKKGSIYMVFDVAQEASLDTSVISNIIYDTINNSYYQSNNISPIQSIEKAIADTRDKIMQLGTGASRGNVSFRIIASVLWGNVLYVVQYGEGFGFLVREGHVRTINTMSEGNFSAASGVIKEEDVIILCTKNFGNKYPPNKLLTTAIKDQELEPGEACLLLKFIVDTQFSEQEFVDFGLDIDKKAKRKKERPLNKLLQVFKKPKKQPLAPTSESKETFSIAPERFTTVRPDIKLRSGSRFNFKPIYLIPIVITALFISIFSTLKARKEGSPDTNLASDSNTQGENAKQTDIVTTQETTDNEVFYDLKIADADAEPTDIAVSDKYVAVTDKSRGKLYISSLETPKFETQEATIENISNIDANTEGMFTFTDTKTFYIYDPAKKAIDEKYEAASEEGLGNITDSYLSFIYTAKNDQIIKYIRENQSLNDPVVWGKSDDFSDAVSMSIEYSIFVLTKEGNLTKFTAGDKTAFEIDEKTGKFTNPTKVLTGTDLENVYVLDNGNKRIVILSKDGEYINEIKNEKWDNMKSISITPEESTLFVLSGSRVYNVKL